MEPLALVNRKMGTPHDAGNAMSLRMSARRVWHIGKKQPLGKDRRGGYFTP